MVVDRPQTCIMRHKRAPGTWSRRRVVWQESQTTCMSSHISAKRYDANTRTGRDRKIPGPVSHSPNCPIWDNSVRQSVPFGTILETLDHPGVLFSVGDRSENENGNVERQQMSCESLISKRARQIGLQTEGLTVARLARFVNLVLEYRDRASLTSLRTSSEVVEGLLVDSLALSMVEGFAIARRCLDIGVGGGFPSVPLAIVSPKKAWIGIDRSHKKVAFLRTIHRSLSLDDYRAICADFCQIAYTHEFASHFDLVVMRALRLDEGLLRAIRSVLSADGRVVLYRHAEGHSMLDVYGHFAHEAPRPREIALEGGIRSLRFEYHDLERLSGAIR